MVKRFLYLNGLAVMAVVLYHATGWGFIAMFWWTDRYRPVQVPDFSQMGSLGYYALRAIEQGVIFGIPLFLFVSGFFIAFATNRAQRTVSWQVIFSRMKSLVIPFLIWSVIIMVDDVLQGPRPPLSKILATILLGEAAPPYYYVPLLMQLYLIAPFLVPLARGRWKLLLVASAGIQMAVSLLNYAEVLNLENELLRPFFILTWGVLFPGKLFWFSLGMVVGFHLPEFKRALLRLRSVLLVGVVVFYALGIVEWELLLKASGREWIGPRETLVDQFFALAFILAFLALEKFIPPLTDQIAYLGGKSFGVYLVHHTAQEYAARLVYHVIPGIFAYQGLFQPYLIAAGLAVPLVVMALVNHSPARRYYEFSFGK